MTAIIFGANGQDGYYLSALLRQQGVAVIGITRSAGFQQCDISDYTAVYNLIKTSQPNFVFHLAANSTTKHDALFENHETISTGTLNILEAVKLTSPHTKVFISGSGLQFTNNNKPIKETDSFEARDAYSASRIQSVYAARYFRLLGVKVYVGYFFNHDSPRRMEQHMSKKIALAAKAASLQKPVKLTIGDLEAIKEYTFAGDVVKGIWTLVNQEKILEANISSGKGYSIAQWLEHCFSLVNLDWRNYVENNNDYSSPYKQLVSDPSIIFSLGWKPEVEINELAKMMMA